MRNRQRKIEELFGAAIQLPVEERAAYVTEHCDDEGLKAEVQSLLEHCRDANANRFLETLQGKSVAEWIKDHAARQDGPFPIRLNCPHCRNPIELVEAEEHDVVCPSCGSSFALDTDRTQSWSPEKLPTLGKFKLEAAVG